MAAEVKLAAPSSRPWRTADRPVVSSSVSFAVMVTASVDLGTTGVCARLISGAMSDDAVELAAPGVPPTTVLGAQFCPEVLAIAEFTSSIDRPKPSAGLYQL